MRTIRTNLPVASSAATTDPRSLALIKRTFARDTTDDEFDTFIATANALRLDPRRRQIHCMIHSKNDAKKRRLTIIVGIDGFRTVAARTGDYRPDEDEPTYTYSDALKDAALNPLGIEKCAVKVWKFSHGAWHPVVGVAYWSEYAPIDEEWAEDDKGRRRPSGKKKLGGLWSQRPRGQIAKCAEAQALRKAWPDDFSNIYADEEMERATIELAASEIVVEHEKQERIERIGGPGILIDWCEGGPLDSIPIGVFADRVMGAVKDMSPAMAGVFADRNRIPLREFWTHHPGDALALKTEIEARINDLDWTKAGDGD